MMTKERNDKDLCPEVLYDASLSFPMNLEE
jgi:hypothetical protein